MVYPTDQFYRRRHIISVIVPDLLQNFVHKERSTVFIIKSSAIIIAFLYGQSIKTNYTNLSTNLIGLDIAFA